MNGIDDECRYCHWTFGDHDPNCTRPANRLTIVATTSSGPLAVGYVFQPPLPIEIPEQPFCMICDMYPTHTFISPNIYACERCALDMQAANENGTYDEWAEKNLKPLMS